MKAVLYWRRMCAHTVCAAIEGATYHMAYIAYLARHSRDVAFSLDELKALEQAREFDAEGEPDVSLTQAQLLERIRFAFHAFARAHHSDYVIPTLEPEWEQVREIFNIKTRLSHPQSTAALAISDDSTTALLEGTAWFMKCMVSLLESSQASMEERASLWEEDKDGPVM